MANGSSWAWSLPSSCSCGGLPDDGRAAQQVLARERAHAGLVEAVEAQDAVGVVHEVDLGGEERDGEAVGPDGERGVEDLRLHVGVERLADGPRGEVDLGRRVTACVAIAGSEDDRGERDGEQRGDAARRERVQHWHLQVRSGRARAPRSYPGGR